MAPSRLLYSRRFVELFSSSSQPHRPKLWSSLCQSLSRGKVSHALPFCLVDFDLGFISEERTKLKTSR